jgi:hypothetical protein
MVIFGKGALEVGRTDMIGANIKLCNERQKL